MKKSFDIFIWAILLFLITPSGMALASWNAVPGDYTYAWKLSLEKVLLTVLSPSDKLQSSTQVKITERRYSEFEQVLDSEYAVESLTNLNQQLDTTANEIQQISQDESRTQVTEQYIETLKEMSNSLSEQKSKAQTGVVAIVAQKSTPTNSTTVSKPAPKTSTATVTNTETQTTPPVTEITERPTAVVTFIPGKPEDVAEKESIAELPSDDTEIVVDEISKTEEKIQETIERLEKEQEINRSKVKEKEDSKESKDQDRSDKETKTKEKENSKD